MVLSKTTTVSPLSEIMVDEHDNEGSFRPEAELTVFLRMRTKEIAKT